MDTLRCAAFLVFLSFVSVCHIASGQQLDEGYRAIVKGRPLLTPVLASDGNYLVAGSIDFFGNDLSGSIIKITPEGQRATGFNRIVTDGDIYHVLALGDGKFMACGKFSKVNGTPTAKLVRFNADGSIDETFAIDPTAEIRRVNVQSTGKIIIAGPFMDYMGSGYDNLARLNGDGSLDETFTRNTMPWPNRVSISGNDEILLNHVYSLMKLTPDGVVDADFHVDLGPTISFAQTDFLPDGKILAAATNYSVHTSTLYRLNEDGSVDASFTGAEMSHQMLAFAALSTGKIVISGVFATYSGELANVILLNADGSFDRILVVTDVNFMHTLFEDHTSGIVMAGSFHSVNNVSNYYIARLQPNYEVDTGFNPEITRSYESWDVGIQSDGRFILSGTFDLIGAEGIRAKVVRLNTDGSVDASFNPQINARSHVTCLEVQADDKMLVGGLQLIEGQQTGFLRLLPNGQIDASFNIGPGPQLNGNPIRADVIRYHKSSVYLAGNFTHFNSQPSPYFVILDKDGNVIGPENKSLPSNSSISDIEVQPDGKIVLMGFFPFSGGTLRLIRLLQDGSLDTSFPGVTISDGLIRDVAIDSYGRIVVIGAFTELNGAAANNIVRINNDGTIDNSFDIGSGIPQDIENTMTSVLILPTDIIAIGGSFELYNGEPSPALAFLHPDGQKIHFFSHINPISNISKMAFRNNLLYCSGRVIFGDGEDVSAAIRIKFDLPVSVSLLTKERSHPLSIYPNPCTDRIYFDLPSGAGKAEVRVYSQTGGLLMKSITIFEEQIALDVRDLPRGNFIVSIRSAAGISNFKLVRN